MSCAEWHEKIAEQVTRTLSPEDRRALEEHLAECAACRAYITELQEDHRLLAAYGDAMKERVAEETEALGVVVEFVRAHAVRLFAAEVAAVLDEVQGNVRIGHLALSEGAVGFLGAEGGFAKAVLFAAVFRWNAVITRHSDAYVVA